MISERTELPVANRSPSVAFDRSPANRRTTANMSRRTKIVMMVVGGVVLLVGLGFLIEILVFAYASGTVRP